MLVARTLGKDHGIPPSPLLMPLCLASQLGGLLTQIGTCTDLLVAALLVNFGLPGTPSVIRQVFSP